MSPPPAYRRTTSQELALFGQAASRPPYRGPLAIAAFVQVLSLLLDRVLVLPAVCGGPWLAPNLAGMPDRLALMLAVAPPGQLVLGWMMMVAGMMLPLLAIPLAHVRQSSLPERRNRAAAGFLIGYFALWLAAGPALVLLSLAWLAITGGGAIGFVLTLAGALAWAASPAQQMAQNRAHRLQPISLYGARADRDCLAFGLLHARWCIAACWAWMVLPMAGGDWHGLIGAGVTLIVLRERFSRSQAPRWRLPAGLAFLRMPAVIPGRIHHG